MVKTTTLSITYNSVILNEFVTDFVTCDWPSPGSLNLTSVTDLDLCTACSNDGRSDSLLVRHHDVAAQQVQLMTNLIFPGEQGHSIQYTIGKFSKKNYRWLLTQI